MVKLSKYSTEEIMLELLSRLEMKPDFFKTCVDRELLQKIELLAHDAKIEKLKLYTNNYEGISIDREQLEKTDKEVMCTSLVLGNIHGNKYFSLGKISIFDARKMLGQLEICRSTSAKQNALVCRVSNFGIKDAVKVKDGINLYEEQVVRQYLENPGYTGNLFTLNSDEKYALVAKDYQMIVRYLIDNSLTWAWGKMTDTQKKTLVYSIHGKGYANVSNRDRIIRMIGNYTTLTELQEGIVKTKTIDRFIIKKSK